MNFRPTRIAALMFGLIYAVMAFAQYPARPIKVVVSIPAGGGPDIIARIIGQKLGEYLGQPMVVENRPGSNGNISADMVAKSPADGYTLLFAQDSLFTINPHLYAKISFSPFADFVPVGTIASNQFFLSVNPSVPVKDFKAFIEYARHATPPLAYASGGNGSQHQLSMEMLKARAGIDLVHVPYKGGAPAAAATVAGETPATFAGASSAALIKAGKLHALAQTGGHRSPAFPELPTIGEFYPGYEVTTWYGLFAPAGTPDPVMARLRAAVAKALAQPEVKEKFNGAGGVEPFQTTVGEFLALMRRDYDNFGKLLKALKVSMD